MNLSMLKNKKFLASFAVIAVIATTAQAAIIVHDPKIYAQIVEQKGERTDCPPERANYPAEGKFEVAG